MVSLFLTLPLTLRVFTVNFEHISHLARPEKCQFKCLIL